MANTAPATVGELVLADVVHLDDAPVAEHVAGIAMATRTGQQLTLTLRDAGRGRERTVTRHRGDTVAVISAWPDVPVSVTDMLRMGWITDGS